ncbi:MAG: glycosyltransferase family 9 protein [Anaerolineae bacterium]
MAETLAQIASRNQAQAAQRHARTRRQQVRGWALQLAARMPVLPAPHDDRTIVLIRPDHLGDVLLTTPAIRALAAAHPESRLVALVGPWSASVISAYPEIDLTVTLPFPGFTRRTTRPGLAPYRMAIYWARRLRALRATAAVVFRPDHWWGGLLAYLAGIPRRVGFDLPDVRPFLTEKYAFRPAHAVLHNAELVSGWTGPLAAEQLELSFPVNPAARERVEGMLRERGLEPAMPRVIIHPGAGTSIKQWPVENWVTVADTLAETWGAPIIFTGTDREIPQVRAITERMKAPALMLAGETGIDELAALYADARVVLGPDSGPLHLAAAVHTPTVSLFGPADPEEFGPWGDPAKHRVLTSEIACRPCRIIDWPGATPDEHPCVRNIPPEAVISAALQAAATHPG